MAITDAALERPDLNAERTVAMGAPTAATWPTGSPVDTERFTLHIVSHASIWSLEQFWGTTDYPEDWADELGYPDTNPEFYDAWSPDRHVESIRTPMLVPSTATTTTAVRSVSRCASSVSSPGAPWTPASCGSPRRTTGSFSRATPLSGTRLSWRFSTSTCWGRSGSARRCSESSLHSPGVARFLCGHGLHRWHGVIRFGVGDLEDVALCALLRP